MDTSKKIRRGRPAKGSEKIKSTRLDIRLTEVEKQGFNEAAELSGLELSAWIRERLRQIAKKELESHGREVVFLARNNGK